MSCPSPPTRWLDLPSEPNVFSSEHDRHRTPERLDMPRHVRAFRRSLILSRGRALSKNANSPPYTPPQSDARSQTLHPVRLRCARLQRAMLRVRLANRRVTNRPKPSSAPKLYFIASSTILRISSSVPGPKPTKTFFTSPSFPMMTVCGIPCTPYFSATFC
jgi:hypothetical protein